MSVVGFVISVLFIIAAGAGGIYGGIRIAKWHYKMGATADLRARALDSLLKIGALLNLHYMLTSVSSAGPALKLARQRSGEAVLLLAELEEALKALGDHKSLVEKVRELAGALMMFSTFCETTAIPGFTKIPSMLEEEMGNAHSIHSRLVNEVTQL